MSENLPATAEEAQAVLDAAQADPGHAFWRLAPDAQTPYYQKALGTSPTFVGDGTVALAPSSPPASSTSAPDIPKTPEEARARLARADQNPGDPLWKDPEEKRRLHLLEEGQTPVPAEKSPALEAFGSHGQQVASIQFPTLSGGESWPAEVKQVIGEVVRDLSLDPTEAQSVVNHLNSRNGQEVSDPDELVDECRNDWGAAFKENVEALFAFAEQIPIGLEKWAEDSNILLDRTTLEWMVRQGHSLRRAQAEIRRIEGDPAHAANNPGHHQHAQAWAELRELYRKAFGSRPVAL